MKTYCLIFCIFFLSSIANFSGADELLKVRFLDVGYGDAILIRFPDGKHGMIDAGASEFSTEIIATLRRLGVARLDFAVITHAHLDHFGGFNDIRRHFEIGHLYLNSDPGEDSGEYFALVSGVREDSISLTVLSRGDEISTGHQDIRILVLHPAVLTGSPNEDSLSLLLVHGAVRFWLTADLQPDGQDAIIRDFPEVLEADVVQVPHHGGRLSQSFDLMPKATVFILSTGENDYGRPFADGLALLPGRLYRTDRDGDIVITSDRKTMKVTRE